MNKRLKKVNYNKIQHKYKQNKYDILIDKNRYIIKEGKNTEF